MGKYFRTGYLTVLLAVAVMFVSCITDANPTDPDAGRREITFSVKVPGAAGATRALTDTDEGNIARVDVLVFEAGESGKFLYAAYATGLADDISGGKKFTVRLLESRNAGDKFDVMVVGNAASILSGAYPSGIPANTSRAEILQNLVYTLPNNTPLGSTSGSTTIPMWGMIEDMVVNNTTGTKNVRLHRMVARIDVALKADIPVTKFKLNSVRLYNYNQTGRLVPDPGNGNFTSTAAITDGVPSTYPQAHTPSLKTGSATTEGPLVYGNAMMTTQYREMAAAIYAFEAAKGVHRTAGDYMKNPCLVVGGYYGDQTSTETFYRIDFVDSGGTFLHLLRNHNYSVTIQSVAGPGYETAQEAFESDFINMACEIIDWGPGDIGDSGFDGPYHFSVSPGEITFECTGGTEILNVDTDYPENWTAKVGDLAGNAISPNWLRINQTTGTSGVTPITLTADPNPSNTTDRTAYIHITAGRVTQKIIVTQKFWLGRNADILYWDSESSTLRVGHWGLEQDYITYGPVNSDNMMFTKFGGVVGFTNAKGEAFNANTSVKFDPTGSVTAYGISSGSNSLPNVPSFQPAHYNAPNNIRNVSLGAPGDLHYPADNASEAYHTLANVRLGRGDICRLVGMTKADIDGMNTDADLYAKEAALKAEGIGGWRLPTTRENYKFVGYYDWETRTINSSDNRNNSSAKYWAPPSYVNAGEGYNGGYFPTGTSDIWSADSYFLPAAGSRSTSGSGSTWSSSVYYWSSTAHSNSTGHCLYFYNSYVYPSTNTFYTFGNSVRCIRD